MTARGQRLLADAADRQDQAREGNLAGHGHVAAHGPPAGGRDDRGGHGDARRRAVLGNRPGGVITSYSIHYTKLYEQPSGHLGADALDEAGGEKFPYALQGFGGHHLQRGYLELLPVLGMGIPAAGDLNRNNFV